MSGKVGAFPSEFMILATEGAFGGAFCPFMMEDRARGAPKDARIFLRVKAKGLGHPLEYPPEAFSGSNLPEAMATLRLS